MISSQKSWQLGLVLIFGFWLWVAGHDFPAPFFDDSYFIGAAINLAQHGDFSNPRCESLSSLGSAGHFFVYMPLHSYLLAAWLRVTGISLLSFHVLYTALAALASLLIYRLFPARKISWLCGLFISLMVYGLLGGVGLRADSLGLVFFLFGLDIYCCRNAFAFFCRNLFLGLAVITFPNVGLLAIVVSLSALIYQKIILKRPMEELGIWLLAMVAAYALCFLLLMICIDGLLVEFLRCMAETQHRGAESVYERFHFFTPLGIAKWAVVQASFFVVMLILFFQWKQPPQRKPQIFLLGVTFLFFLILGFSSINSATGAHLWAFGCLIAWLFFIVDQDWSMRALGAWAIVCVVAAFGHAHVAIEACLADAPPSPGNRAALLAEIEHRHPRRLNVDVYAMRELYDYRLPDNAYYFEWCNTDGWAAPINAATMPPDSLSVVSVKNAYLTHLSTGEGDRARFLKILGHTLPGAYQNLFDLVLIDNRLPEKTVAPGQAQELKEAR